MSEIKIQAEVDYFDILWFKHGVVSCPVRFAVFQAFQKHYDSTPTVHRNGHIEIDNEDWWVDPTARRYMQNCQEIHESRKVMRESDWQQLKPFCFEIGERR